ncbi:MAG: diguanylate cyclase [Sedimentisphaerales bacterium]|nr:diguanylate cyclase [Sedimentisphaerales bacterium]
MSTDRQNATILVVDDDAEICSIVGDVLKGDGLDCDTAYDVSQAESLIAQNGYDIIISDIAMPDKNGFDLLHEVSKNHPNARTILITGKQRQEWVAQAMRDGAFDYIEKPFDLGTLRNVVQRALQLQRLPLHHQDPRRLSERYCIVMLDHEGVVRYVDDNFASIYAGSPIAAIGLPLEEVFPAEHMVFETLADQAGMSRKAALTLKRATGQEFPAEVSIEKADISGEHPSYLLRLVDVSPIVSETSEPPRSLTQQRSNAGHDPLTGLPNHCSFQEELSRVRASCRRYGRTFAVMIINVEGLRNLNVTHGHAYGDVAIIELGQLCRSQVRAVDYVARYAGTQFGLILPETDDSGALILAKRIRDLVLEREFNAGSSKTQLSVSIGIAECHSGYVESQHELLASTEEALAQARKQPQDPIVLWDVVSGVKTCAAEMRKNSGNSDDDGEIEKRLRTANLSMVRTLVAAVEAKDPYTKDHSLNVAEYAEYFARCLGLSEKEISVIRCAATLHDLGKIGIPDAILTKPAKLTNDEFRIIKMHTVIGYEILSQCNFFDAEAEMVRHHHERFDGNGYPDRLSREDFSLGARILQVADTLDTMVCARFYKKAYPLEKVISELTEHSGRQFDPEIAKLAIDLVQNHPEKIRYSEFSNDFDAVHLAAASV